MEGDAQEEERDNDANGARRGVERAPGRRRGIIRRLEGPPDEPLWGSRELDEVMDRCAVRTANPARPPRLGRAEILEVPTFCRNFPRSRPAFSPYLPTTHRAGARGGSRRLPRPSRGPGQFRSVNPRRKPATSSSARRRGNGTRRSEPESRRAEGRGETRHPRHPRYPRHPSAPRRRRTPCTSRPR